jgi:hypothetical protein
MSTLSDAEYRECLNALLGSSDEIVYDEPWIDGVDESPAFFSRTALVLTSPQPFNWPPGSWTWGVTSNA